MYILERSGIIQRETYYKSHFYSVRLKTVARLYMYMYLNYELQTLVPLPTTKAVEAQGQEVVMHE